MHRQASRAHLKAVLREKARENVRILSTQNMLDAGIHVAQHINRWLSTSGFELKSAALFLSLKDEISTKPLAAVLKQRGISLSWPKIEPKHIMTFEPDSLFNIIFLPGLAFDRTGHRLGRGLGCYDRYLSGLDQRSGRPILVGLCLDEQLFESVPIEAHDVVMDYICTPKLGMQKVTGE